MYSNFVYEKIGSSGPVIVFLHGWGQNLNAFRPLAELFCDRAQLVLFDLPGFGKAPAPDHVWSSFDYAEHVMKALQSMGVSSFSVCGHSFGGKVAMSLATRYPQQVQSLVLLAASGLQRKRTLIERVRLQGIRALRWAVKAYDRMCTTRYFETMFIPRFGSRDYKNADPSMRSILVKSVSEDFTPYLQEIACPTLLLWGKDDLETPVEMAYRLQSHIPRSELKVFSHKDHYLLSDCGYHLAAYHMQQFFEGCRVHE